MVYMYVYTYNIFQFRLYIVGMWLFRNRAGTPWKSACSVCHVSLVGSLGSLRGRESRLPHSPLSLPHTCTICGMCVPTLAHITQTYNNKIILKGEVPKLH